MIEMLLVATCLCGYDQFGRCGYDQYGRQVCWETQPGFGATDPLSPVRPNVFGPNLDRYGRPMQQVPAQEQGFPRQNRSWPR
jgi:hypothetical protein